MAREIKGCARKRELGKVPHYYGSLRRVTPPVGEQEMRTHQRDAAMRRYLNSL